MSAKNEPRKATWNEDEFSELMSDQEDELLDIYESSVCQVCDEGEMRPIWHTGFDRFIQLLLPLDKVRCRSCRSCRWQFNYFKGFSASTFVLYAATLAVVLFFGSTVMGIWLDRQAGGAKFQTAQAAPEKESVQEVQQRIQEAADTPDGPPRFKEITQTPLSKTLFEPVETAATSPGPGSVVALLPPMLKLRYVPADELLVALEQAGDTEVVAAEPSSEKDFAPEVEPNSDVPVLQSEDLLAEIADDPLEGLGGAVTADAAVAVKESNTVDTEQTETHIAAVDTGTSTSGLVASVEEAAVPDLASASEPVEKVPVAAGSTGDVWLFGMSDSAYTAQLGSFGSQEEAEGFLARNQLAGNTRAHVLRTVSNDKVWFYVLYGSFPGQADAEEAASSMAFSNPWIRKISSLRAKRCTAWKTLDTELHDTYCL